MKHPPAQAHIRPLPMPMSAAVQLDKARANTGECYSAVGQCQSNDRIACVTSALR